MELIFINSITLFPNLNAMLSTALYCPTNVVV